MTIFRVLAYPYKLKSAAVSYDTIRYLVFLGFHPVAVALTLVHKRQITVIYRRRNTTVHRTHKTGSKTYKAIKQK
jgi:hypothetical protein